MRPLRVLPIVGFVCACATGGPTPPESTRITHGLLGGPKNPDLVHLCATDRTPTVGEWASFRAHTLFSGDVLWRDAVIGSEQHGDTTFFWRETRYTVESHDPAREGTVQSLAPRAKTLRASELRIQALLIKPGRFPAAEVRGAPLQHIVQELSRRPDADACDNAQVIGWESVTVPGGSFRALHVKSAEGDQWVTDSVPGRLVRETSIAHDVVLTGYGGSAHSSVSEIPLPIGVWMARMQGNSGAASVNWEDTLETRATTAALCDSLAHAALLEPDTTFPVVIAVGEIEALLPGFEQRPERIAASSASLRYPGHMKSMGLEGDVVTQAILDTNGLVDSAHYAVTRASNPGFVPSARALVLGSRFKPARICGRATRSVISLPVQFRLH